MPKKSSAPKKKSPRLRELAGRLRAEYHISTHTSTRTVRTRWLTYKHPAQLLRDAANVVPEFVVYSVHLFRSEMENTLPGLSLGMGSDDSGYHHSIKVYVSDRCLREILLYLVAKDAIGSVMMIGPIPDVDVDDSGEELHVPTVTEAELAAMKPAVPVQ